MDDSGNSSQAPLNGQIKKPFQWPHDDKQKDEDVKKEEEKTEDKEEKKEEKVVDSTQKTPSNQSQSQDTVIHYPYGSNAKKSETPSASTAKSSSDDSSSGSSSSSSSFQLLKDDDRKTIDELKEHALKMVAEERAEIERQAEERKKQLAAVEESLSDPRITEAFYYLSRAKDKVSGS